MKSDGEAGPRRDTISLADEQGVKQVVVSSVLGLREVVNNLTRLRPTRSDRYRVSIFGSARAKPGTFAYEEVRRIGTVLEAMMIWQLLQVRHIQGTPLIFVGKMWPGLVDWARTFMLSSDPPLANPEDMTIPRCVATADEAISLIREHHARWLGEQKGSG